MGIGECGKLVEGKCSLSESRFPLLRRLSIVSLMAMLATASVLIYLYREDQLTEHAIVAARQNQEALLYLVHVLKDQNLTPEGGDGINAKRPPAKQDIDLLVSSALAAIAQKDVLKVKIYSLSGIAIYSSFADEIGTTSRHPDFLSRTLQGETVNSIEHRASFFGMNGELHDVDIALTYMPMTQAGKRVGVIEIYKDTSQIFKRVQASIIRIAITVFAAFAALYGALFYAVLRTDRAIAGWQKAVAESEASLRESQFIAGVGSYDLDIRSGSWKSSEMLDRIFGIDEAYRHEVSGWEALLHPEDRTMMIDYLRNEVIGQRKAFDKQFRIVRHNDQAERWVHGFGKLELDARGYPVTMRGTLQDITELHEFMQQTSRLSRRNQALLDNSMEGVHIMDIKGNVLEVNDAFCRMLGYTREEALRLNVTDWDVQWSAAQLHERFKQMIGRSAQFETGIAVKTAP